MITHRVLPIPSLVNVFVAFILFIFLLCVGVALIKVFTPIEEKYSMQEDKIYHEGAF